MGPKFWEAVIVVAILAILYLGYRFGDFWFRKSYPHLWERERNLGGPWPKSLGWFLVYGLGLILFQLAVVVVAHVLLGVDYNDSGRLATVALFVLVGFLLKKRGLSSWAWAGLWIPVYNVWPVCSTLWYFAKLKSGKVQRTATQSETPPTLAPSQPPMALADLNRSRDDSESNPLEAGEAKSSHVETPAGSIQTDKGAFPGTVRTGPSLMFSNVRNAHSGQEYPTFRRSGRVI